MAKNPVEEALATLTANFELLVAAIDTMNDNIEENHEEVLEKLTELPLRGDGFSILDEV